MVRMQSVSEEGKRQMQACLEELWREVEAFARAGAAAHEVGFGKHSRQNLTQGWFMVALVGWMPGSRREWRREAVPEVG
jgi:hypothetical protein